MNEVFPTLTGVQGTVVQYAHPHHPDGAAQVGKPAARVNTCVLVHAASLVREPAALYKMSPSAAEPTQSRNCVKLTSSTSQAHAVFLPSTLLVTETFCILAYVTASLIILAVVIASLAIVTAKSPAVYTDVTSQDVVIDHNTATAHNHNTVLHAAALADATKLLPNVVKSAREAVHTHVK